MTMGRRDALHDKGRRNALDDKVARDATRIGVPLTEMTTERDALNDSGDVSTTMRRPMKVGNP